MRNQFGTGTKIALFVAALGATAAWGATTASLTYDGDVVSHSVRVIDGRPYVPLADVAHMLHGSVVSIGEGYEIQTAGGADQVGSAAGGVGKMLFAGGKWRFEVTGVSHTPQFTTQYETAPETVDPSGANDELVVVSCIVKNAQTAPHQLILRLQNTYNTALTDRQEASYPPIHFDFAGGSAYGPTLLPGSAQHFNVVFSVPKGTDLKDLVFSIMSFDDKNPTDVRVPLNQ